MRGRDNPQTPRAAGILLDEQEYIIGLAVQLFGKWSQGLAEDAIAAMQNARCVTDEICGRAQGL